MKTRIVAWQIKTALGCVQSHRKTRSELHVIARNLQKQFPDSPCIEVWDADSHVALMPSKEVISDNVGSQA